METTKQNKRKENAQRAKTLVSDAIETLAATLEQGRSEQLKNHLAAIARFHSYSWGNVALIISQRPDATQVAGFNAWRKLGRQVKKGEKGIMIRAPYLERPSHLELGIGAHNDVDFKRAIQSLKQYRRMHLHESAKGYAASRRSSEALDRVRSRKEELQKTAKTGANK